MRDSGARYCPQEYEYSTIEKSSKSKNDAIDRDAVSLASASILVRGGRHMYGEIELNAMC